MKAGLRGALQLAGVLILLTGLGRPGLGQRLEGGNGTLFIGALPNHLVVIDEASEKIERRVSLKSGAARELRLSSNHRRLYVMDADMQEIEVVDTLSREVVDHFTLNDGDRKVRIWHYEIDPLERYLFLVMGSYRRLMDRFDIGPLAVVQYDLKAHRVLRTLPWPDSEEQDCVKMMFSPDGRLLYLFFDDILIFDTVRFEQVGVWEISRPAETGLGPIQLSSECRLDPVNEAPGFLTDQFTVHDRVQNRELMGVARLSLVERTMDYFLLGPAVEVSFSLAPGRKRAYGLLGEIGRYEFWSFDLANRRLKERKEFWGRPRMEVKVSTNGKLLYIYQANDAIDVHEASSFEYLRTIALDADQRTHLMVVPPLSGVPGTALR